MLNKPEKGKIGVLLSTILGLLVRTYFNVDCNKEWGVGFIFMYSICNCRSMLSYGFILCVHNKDRSCLSDLMV